MNERTRVEIPPPAPAMSSFSPIDNIQLRSEVVQEIISRKPDFLEKWSLFMFLCILLLLLLLCWVIKYPDVIEAPATLTAANAPKEIMPRQDGRLVKLFVQNNESVLQGQVIGWLESTGSHKEIMELSTFLDSSLSWLNTGKLERMSSLLDTRYRNLGEMQHEYQQFITASQQFNDYVVNGFYLRRRNLLQQDISSLDNLKQTIRTRQQLTEEDVALAQETYRMNEVLAEEKVLSKDEFRAEKSKLVNKQMAIPDLEAGLLSNETQKRDKLKELEQLDHDISQQKIVFQQALQSLKSSIGEWTRKYVLQSPIDGSVFFTISLQENQFLQQGRLLGYVTPNDSRFYMESYLPQRNFGKIDTGLAIQLRFDAYPYQEVGPVAGTLNYVSHVASDSGFLATIRLNNGLVTNNKMTIPYKSGLKAKAIIIKKDMRLLDRFYYSMVGLISIDK